jgi:hypothetical protein
MISMILNKKIILNIVFAASAFSVMAQTTTSSLYSQFGIGEIQKRGSIQSIGMGNLSNGIKSNTAGNFVNPASYSDLTLTTFEVTGISRITTLKTNSAQQTNYNSTLTSLSLSFPLAKKWGASFGLKPLSSVGYKVSVPTVQPGVPGTVTQIYEGSGGTNQFYIGTGYNIYKGLSIGVNASYLFGKISTSKANEFNDSLGYLNVRRVNATSLGGIYFNYGIQYTHALKKDLNFIAGYSGAVETEIQAKRSMSAITYKRSGENITSETVSGDPVEEKGTIVLPNFNSIGFVIEKKNEWLLGTDISIGDWSNFRDFGADQNLKNTLDVGLGGQYTPRYNAVGNYLKTIDYRLGLNYGQSYVSIGGEDINQYSINGGLGLPLPRAGAKINLAVEVGQRGTTNQNLIKEEFINIHFGITFNDKWFVKRKYD